MTTYILVDPNSDSGMNDDVLDRLEMTEVQAKKWNDERRESGSDLRWIKETNLSDIDENGNEMSVEN